MTHFLKANVLIMTQSLNISVYKLPETNSKLVCHKNCYKAGFIYYGLEFGQECFCGNQIRNATNIDDALCTTYKCSGSDEFCGGFNAIEIFRTGLKQEVSLSKPKFEIDESNKVKKAKILFLLQLNGRNERQVKRFIRSIYSKNHYYYIHVDKRQKFMHSEMTKVAKKLENVVISQKRFSTIWGGASLLEMFLEVIRESLQNENINDWDYIVNFSESDFPVLPFKDFENLINANIGYSFLAAHGYNTGRFIQKQGFEYVFLECEERMWRIGRRDFPSNLRIDGGSDWVGIHRDLAEYSVSSEEMPSKLRKMFSSILLPLESFYHTLSHNSKFCGNVLSSNLRLTNWYRKQGCRCEGLKKVVDWCGCSPLVFRNDTVSKFDMEKARNKPTYFARKFDSIINIDAIASAELQAVGVDRIDVTHPSYHSAFVSLYKRDIDGDASHLFNFAKSINIISKTDAVLKSLARIDVFKAHSKSPFQIVLSTETTMGKYEYLVQRVPHFDIFPHEDVDGYVLTNITYGSQFDLKEEVCREFIGIITKNSTVQLRLLWVPSAMNRTPPPKKMDKVKTSPDVVVRWRNSEDVVIATNDVKSSSSSSKCNEYSADIFTPKNLKIGSIHFPVMAEDDPECNLKMTSRFYDNDKLQIISEFNMLDFQWRIHAIGQQLAKFGSDAHKGKITLDQIASEINCMDSFNFRHILPPPKMVFTAPYEKQPAVQYTDIYRDDFIHGNIFGLMKKGNKVPLHDHPNMSGVMKVITGSILLRTYSILQTIRDEGNPWGRNAIVRFDGEKIISSRDQVHSTFLDAQRGNIHEVIALEDNSYFLDVFLPGDYPKYVMEQLRQKGWSLNDNNVAELFDAIFPENASVLENTLLNEDIRDFGDQCIVNLHNKESRIYSGPSVLQISKIRNVCIPKIREDFGSSPDSSTILRIFLTDGHTTISAISLEKISGISADTPPGTKVLLISEIPVEGIFLILTPANTKVFGGKVAKLIEKWNVERKEDEQDEFAKNREQTLKDLLSEEVKQQKKVFSRPNVALPEAKPVAAKLPKIPKQPKEEKPKRRRGRDSVGEEIAEYVNKQSATPKLADFLGEMVAPSTKIPSQGLPTHNVSHPIGEWVIHVWLHGRTGKCIQPSLQRYTQIACAQ
ncbi:unnamed protein product [Caenorhabditis bovis]|uniref:protein xylosyltransferase n=1 Tax=Caenorhabditis bovis TaxID=2654633 RepID=A0A8S1EDR6_9PELO|nr:unnamed protein product [Caenorhabditis bovis]